MSQKQKYVVWYRENGTWVEQGDGAMTFATCERIVRELCRECGGSYRILAEGVSP